MCPLQDLQEPVHMIRAHNRAQIVSADSPDRLRFLQNRFQLLQKQSHNLRTICAADLAVHLTGAVDIHEEYSILVDLPLFQQLRNPEYAIV